MICGYEWETDSECDTADDQSNDDHECQGQHQCCLQDGHEDLEHECDCGDTSIDDADVVKKCDAVTTDPDVYYDQVYRNNDQAMMRCIVETLE